MLTGLCLSLSHALLQHTATHFTRVDYAEERGVDQSVHSEGHATSSATFGSRRRTQGVSVHATCRVRARLPCAVYSSDLSLDSDYSSDLSLDYSDFSLDSDYSSDFSFDSSPSTGQSAGHA
jgi:hypothetical protein